VSAVDAPPAPEAALTLRHAEDPETVVSPSAVACSGPLCIQDVSHRKRTTRLLVVRFPPFATDARRPRPLVLHVNGAPLLSCRDSGMQAFFFGGVQDAKQFLEAGLRVVAAEPTTSLPFTRALVDLAAGRLQPPVDSRDPFVGFFLE